MSTREKKIFKGFSPATLKFLRGLKANNNKAWFAAHRADYEKHLLGPLRDLVTDLSDFMLGIDMCFEIDPVVSKTISRIHRDTRFSRDKSPYRSVMWIAFGRPSENWMDDPGFFFEISPNRYRYGMGFYSASPETMRRFRGMIDERPKEVLKLISFYSKQKTFAVGGEKYKRILDKSKPEEIQDWYQRKNLHLICARKINGCLFSNKLVDKLIYGFGLAAPLYQFFRKVQSGQAGAAVGINLEMPRSN